MSDLTVVMADMPDPVTAGDALTCVITVTNQGPAPATGVVVTGTLPSAFQGAATTGCTEDPSGSPICSLGSISPGNSAVYTVSATVDITASGIVTSTLQVGASSALTNTENDTINEPTTVNKRMYYYLFPEVRN